MNIINPVRNIFKIQQTPSIKPEAHHISLIKNIQRDRKKIEALKVVIIDLEKEIGVLNKQLKKKNQKKGNISCQKKIEKNAIKIQIALSLMETLINDKLNKLKELAERMNIRIL